MAALDPTLLERLGVALATGLLVGFERGWEQRAMSEGERVAGFRTFALAALLGACAAIVGEGAAGVLAAAGVGLGAVAALGYYRTSTRERGRSATGAVALLLTFALGAMAGRGLFVEAASAAVVVTLILGFKPELHGLLDRIDREELLATIRLLLISVVVLPVLPNQGYGPWQALNPYRLWWMVVLVAAVSYAGYFANRVCGREGGSVATGLVGGLVSSTVVSLTLSRRAAAERGHEDALAAGIVVASSIMFLRLMVIVAPVAPALLGALAAPMVAAGAVGLVLGGVLALRSRSERSSPAPPGIEHRNPLDLATAAQFGAFLALVMLASRGLGAALGDRGLYLVASVAGLADVDALALSAAALANDGTTTAEAAIAAMLVAAAVNTVVKAGITVAVGGVRLGARVSASLVAALAAGGAAWWLAGG